MSDALYSGMRFRVLNIIDEGVREALDIVVDTSITATRLVANSKDDDELLNYLTSKNPKKIKNNNYHFLQQPRPNADH